MPLLADVRLVLEDPGSRRFVAEPRQIEIGRVRFNGWQIEPVPVVNFPDYLAYLVKVNVDLVVRPTVRGPQWLEFGFLFDTEGVHVTDMVPRAVREPRSAIRYALTRQLAFTPDTGAADGDAVILTDLPLPAVTPTIEAAGIGSPSVSWRHTNTTPRGVPLGTHSGWMTVLAPADERKLDVRATAAYALQPPDDLGFDRLAVPDTFTVDLPDRTGSHRRSPAGGDQARLAFTVDVVAYSARSSSGQEEVQQRVDALVRAALIATGVGVSPAAYAPTGDGVNVIFPDGTDWTSTIPRLVIGLADGLAADNAARTDRIRLRMAIDVGPISPAALGFAGPTIVRLSRLVDADVTRRYVNRRPNADLVVAVTDWVHENLIRPVSGGLAAEEFVREIAVAKGYQTVAWLWTSSG